MGGMAGNGNMGGMGGDHGPGSMLVGEDRQVSEENRKVLDWIAQVLSASTREAALLELSKKREQVPELALILWHSFGMYSTPLSRGWDGGEANGGGRCHDFAAPGDHIGVPAA